MISFKVIGIYRAEGQERSKGGFYVAFRVLEGDVEYPAQKRYFRGSDKATQFADTLKLLTIGD